MPLMDNIRSFFQQRKGPDIPYPKLRGVLQPFVHSLATYKKVRNVMAKEMVRGLTKSGRKSCTMKMLITYVQNLPHGNEVGSFLALDLGGTNFRVLLVDLRGQNVHMDQKIYPISDELMVGPGSQLFDYIAGCIENFVTEKKLQQTELPLGFTFSFPLKQEGLAVGRLIEWTKGFSCSGVAGENVVELLQTAIKRRDLRVDCNCVVNDTVGCLMSCAFHDTNTCCGVILGTGTNACYIEKLENVELWDGTTKGPRQVIINMEWGAFGDSGAISFVEADIDKEIDRNSINPGRQRYEKLISGMYMGEQVRLIIVSCIKKGILFNGKLSNEFKESQRFYTKYISEIEKDSENDVEFRNTRNVLDEMGVVNPSIDDLKHVRYIAEVISCRSAYLAAAGVACVVNKMGRPKSTVAVDGSLYRFHPHYSDRMMKMILDLTKDGVEVAMMLSEDGSGKGAALIACAAAASKQGK